ncbi:MAG: Lin0512 family protein [Alphaproteobacteria bacterium]|nr:Lin0512 family protein [Alphaproteobacteria bacterium]
MAEKRAILEMGAGAALHGGDYTKAACRAVQDAIHHSSLTFIRSLGLDSKQMKVMVTIGVQKPDEVDLDIVKAILPHGDVSISARLGGLDVPDEQHGDLTVIASAAIDVRYDFDSR